MKEAAELFYLHFVVKGYEWLQQQRVRRLFYNNPQYKKLDRELLRGPNPYRIEEAFPYGETPLSSLKKIADRFGLNASDRVVDLGCGRGRGVFFLAEHYGCHAHGIDKVAPFIARAKDLVKKHQPPRVSFECGDMRSYDFSQATCIFFYGTTFKNRFVAELTSKFSQMPPGGKIITVSYPLEGFEVKDEFSVSFPWGKGDVYLHIR